MARTEGGSRKGQQGTDTLGPTTSEESSPANSHVSDARNGSLPQPQSNLEMTIGLASFAAYERSWSRNASQLCLDFKPYKL